MSNVTKIKKTTTKQVETRTAHKLVNQAKKHLLNTESQVITPKKGKVGKSSSRRKVNIGILRAQQPTKIIAQKAETSKGTSKINILDIRKETGLSGAGAKGA